jgi:hypothetical protein
MTRDAEFSTYLAARWSALVRSLVLPGCDPEEAEDEAEDVVQAGLVRCHASRRRVGRRWPVRSRTARAIELANARNQIPVGEPPVTCL